MRIRIRNQESGIFLTLDLGWKKSATLICMIRFFLTFQAQGEAD
jgi:hypothetical protein